MKNNFNLWEYVAEWEKYECIDVCVNKTHLKYNT